MAFACGAAAATDDALYRELGAGPGLVALSDDFMARLLADPRTRPFFQDVEAAPFKQHLVEQLCEVSGGPCTYSGKDMKRAHSAQDVSRSNFNALVEVLQQSMQARGIPFSVQNRLLARLAPMYRDIVNTP
ncbi:MAG: group 1 truncated hemoglobin [Pseudomonadota bacterium]|nr:group 1 truncated hemoglobin [Pseudomonadota bacterium]